MEKINIDELTVNYIARKNNENDDLIKALFRAGLIKKKIWINGKSGGYWADRWVRVNDKNSAPSNKIDNGNNANLGTGRITVPSPVIKVACYEYDGKRYKAVSSMSGSYITSGKGNPKMKKIDKEPELIKNYGGKSGEWSHGRCKMDFVWSDESIHTGDVHYQYEPSVGFVEQRIEKWFN